MFSLVFHLLALTSGAFAQVSCPPKQNVEFETWRNACKERITALKCAPNGNPTMVQCTWEEYSELGQSLTTTTKGCLIGAGIPIKDSKNFWFDVYGKIKERGTFFNLINGNVNLKRALIADVPYLTKLSNESLNRYSAEALEMKRIQFQLMIERSSSQPALIPEPKDSNWELRGSITDLPPENVGSTLRELVMDYFSSVYHISPRCMKPQAQSALVCLGLAAWANETAKLLAPGVGFKLTAAGVRLLQRESPALLDYLRTRGTVAEEASPGVSSAALNMSPLEKEIAIQKFVEQYKSKSVTSPTDNKRFALRVESTQTEGRGVMVVQNTLVKEINSRSKNPAVADALNNRYNEILFSNGENVAIRDGIDIRRYASYKEGNLAPNSEDYSKFRKFAEEVHGKTMREFIEDPQVRLICEKYGLNVNDMMRLGIGPDYERAQKAARDGRTNPDPHKITDAHDPMVRARFEEGLKDKNRLQTQLTKKFRGTELMEDVDESFGGKRWIPSLKTTEIVRKYKADPEAIRVNLEKTFRVKVDPTDVENLLDYAKSVDRLSSDPLILIPESLQLPEARHGVIAIDLPGIGAANQHELSKKLADVWFDVDKAIDVSKAAEQNVTDQLNRIRGDFKKVTQSTMGEKKFHFINSGDDIFIIPREPVDEQTLTRTIRELSRIRGYGPPRFSTSPIGVQSVTQAEQLLQHGMNIEKDVRSHLAGAVDWERMENVSMRFDMLKEQGGKIPVKMHLEVRNVDQGGLRRQIPTFEKLTETEEAKVRESFRKALEEFNKKNKTSYTLAP